MGLVLEVGVAFLLSESEFGSVGLNRGVAL